MALSIITSPTAITSAPVSTQISSQVVTSSYDGYNLQASIDVSVYSPSYDEYQHDLLPGEFLTIEEAIYYGSDNDIGVIDAFQQMDDILRVPLVTTGCILDPGPPHLRNCSESCLQATSIFDHISTLVNCISLPLIADFIAAGNLSDRPKIIAESFGISGNLSLAHLAKSTLSSCFWAYCNKSITCLSDYSYNETEFRNNVDLYSQSVNICRGVEQTVLADIAGIGVRIIIL